MDMRKNKHRIIKRLALWLIALMLFTFACACRPEEPDEGDQIDLSDPSGAENIVTAAQLLLALEEGNSDTLTLSASIDLGDEMLKLDEENASLTIIGNGNTISGNGDCIIRLASGCSLTLEDITLNAGSNAIGCLGGASIAGSATIKAVAHAIYSMGDVRVGGGSRLFISSNVGNGINAAGLELKEDARVRAEGGLGGVSVTRDGIVLNVGSVLDSNTNENYNALKCEGTLVMYDGSKLIVKNNGEYHGAEVSEIIVEGTVGIEAQGGSKGVGLFMFRIDEAINVVGYCEPELRFEVGNGGISFYESASEFPTPTPPMETEETPS